jgi:hypothetical protein
VLSVSNCPEYTGAGKIKKGIIKRGTAMRKCPHRALFLMTAMFTGLALLDMQNLIP